MKHIVQLVAILGALAVPIAPARAGEPLPPGLTAEGIASATTPQEHQAIADAYAKEAENLRAHAAAHRAMDSHYNEPGYLSAKLGMQRHCRALVEAYEAAAKDAEALAKAHHEMAEAAGKKAN